MKNEMPAGVCRPAFSIWGQGMDTRAGFTLIEIIVVVTIIAGLASMALPNYFFVTESMQAKNAQKILIELYGSQKRYQIRHDTYASALNDLDIVPRFNGIFQNPSVVSSSDTTFQMQVARVSPRANYVLRVDQTGQITCVGTSPENICQRLGL